MTQRNSLENVLNFLNSNRKDIEYISGKYENIYSKLQVKCLDCGYIWYAMYTNLHKGSGCPYCSNKIKRDLEYVSKYLLNKNILLLSNVYIDNKTKLDCKCLVCNNIFSIRFNDVQQGKSCRLCGIKRRSGDKHYFWKGGKSKEPYPPEWTFELRESIRNRDRRKCQFQDCEYDDTKEDRRLCVHHIDSNKRNCEEYNLISLCLSHHVKVETNPISWQDYFYQITGDYKMEFV